MENLKPNKNIQLEGSGIFVTQNSTDVFKVTNGNVLIYILPWLDDAAGRRSFLCEAKESSLIPSYFYTDATGKSWRFGFVAIDRAELEILSEPVTASIRDDFAKSAAIDNYDIEGFDDSLVERYELNIVAEDALIYQTDKDRKQVYESGLSIIYDLFGKKKKKASLSSSSGNALYDAMNYICEKNRIPITSFEKIQASCKSDITVKIIARMSHFACREVVLEGDWHKKDLGYLLAFLDNNSKSPIICVPHGRAGYIYHNPQTGESGKITGKVSETLQVTAYMFYRPFPNKKLNIKDLMKFGFHSIKLSDLGSLLVFALIGSLIGLLIPMLNQLLYDTLIPTGSTEAVIQICGVILAVMIGNLCFSIVQSLSSFRLSSRVLYHAQSAAYDRLFSLPESFFRKFDSGDLAQRAMGISSVLQSILNVTLNTFLTGILSFVYFFWMLGYSSILAGIAIAMLLLYAGMILAISQRIVRYAKKNAEYQGKISSILYQFINGIDKIRIAGVEDRALLEYLKPYTESTSLSMKGGRLQLKAQTLELIANSIFSIVLYYAMVSLDTGLTVGSFIAFFSAFGSFSGAILQTVGAVSEIQQIQPVYKRIKPILDTCPEYDDTKEIPGEITGEVELNNVTFAYDEGSMPVIENFSLKIEPGEYIGIVGQSGCGKSTLLKLLLGFEKPQIGKIFYNEKDMESLDKRELRKKFGVVLQDGKLIAGSIYDNITITAPGATYEQVEEIVKAVGLENDIRNMPMGLHTVLSEGSNTISGGQQQRILIARAIAGKPKILFFDEATSALDNKTQSLVCESLDSMKVTRLVIAHRLSTIIKCDRILVMDKGHIIEHGNYDELMKKKGAFYELASRQF